MKSDKKVRRFNPKIHKPKPEDHKILTEMAAFVTARYKELRKNGRPELLQQALLGGTLAIIKEDFRPGVYTWWIKKYLPFSCRTARRYKERFYDYQIYKELDPEGHQRAVENLKPIARYDGRQEHGEAA
jgi:hypothetical protein